MILLSRKFVRALKHTTPIIHVIAPEYPTFLGSSFLHREGGQGVRFFRSASSIVL
jgi:hypothetical protein